MNGRELIRATLNKQNSGANAFWVGHPTDEAKKMYYRELGIAEEAESELEKHNAADSVLLTKKGGRGGDRVQPSNRKRHDVDLTRAGHVVLEASRRQTHVGLLRARQNKPGQRGRVRSVRGRCAGGGVCMAKPRLSGFHDASCGHRACV